MLTTHRTDPPNQHHADWTLAAKHSAKLLFTNGLVTKLLYAQVPFTAGRCWFTSRHKTQVGCPTLEVMPNKKSRRFLLVFFVTLQRHLWCTICLSIDVRCVTPCLWLLIVTILSFAWSLLFSSCCSTSASQSRVFFLDYGGTLVKDTPRRPSAGIPPYIHHIQYNY